MILHCSILKPLFQPTWLENVQIEAQHHQKPKQVPKESIRISLSKITYHHIFQSLKIFVDDVNIATKKELTQKIMSNVKNAEFSNA